VAYPDRPGDTTAEASLAIALSGLNLGTVSSVIDRTCNNIGLVVSQNPAAGSVVPPGTPVNIAIGQLPPPPFQCP
jgi:beta-lactam-binding protein with PASTA domain